MNLGLILTEKSEHDTSGKRLILFVKEIDQVLMKTFHSSNAEIKEIQIVSIYKFENRLSKTNRYSISI